MGQRSEQAKTDPFARYAQWLEQSNHSERVRWWSILGGVSVVLVTVASLLPFGGQWLKAIVAFPAALMLFVVIDSFFYTRNRDNNIVPLRERYSARQRRRYAGIVLVVLIILALVVAPYIPYAVGGTLLLLALLNLVNFVRMTTQESEFEEAGIIDPRDVTEETVFVEDPDILDDDEDVSWDAYLDDEDDIDDFTERRGA